MTAAGIDDRVRELERQYVDRQVALTNVLRIIGESTADLRTTLGEVLESALQLCQADFGTIYLPDEGGYRIAASAGPGKDEIYAYERDHADRPGRHSVTGRVLLSRGPVLIADVLADPEYDQPDAQRISRFRSLLGVPIEREGEIIGVFNLGRYEVRPYTDAEIALVSLYAEQAGVAIENARFIATIERQRREYLDRQTALNEILRIIGGSGFALGSVLDTVVESAARLANAEFANVYLDDGTGTYRIATSLMGPDEFAYEREHPPTASDESVAGRVILTGGVVHVEDITTDDSYTYATGLSGGYRTLLGVPITRAGTLVGVLALARKELARFTESEILLVSTFAEQVAIAIENARLLDTIERQKSELTRYLSPQIAGLIASDEAEGLLAGHRRRITVVMCDLRGFTSFSETAEPEEVLGVLREYHAALGRLIVDHDGTLEHFAGDGVMVFFNDPALQDDHEIRAIRMALAMREAVTSLASGWRRLGYDLGFGVGVVAGYATLGRIGFEGRYDYGAVGNAVNLASRLSSEARPGQILIDQRTFAAIEELVEAEPIGELQIKGLTRPVAAYDVHAVRDPSMPAA